MCLTCLRCVVAGIEPAHGRRRHHTTTQPRSRSASRCYNCLGPCRIPQPAPAAPLSAAAWPWDPLGRTNCPEQPAQPGGTASSVLLRPPFSTYVLGLCWVLLWAPRQSTFDRARPPGAFDDAPGLSGPSRCILCPSPASPAPRMFPACVLSLPPTQAVPAPSRKFPEGSRLNLTCMRCCEQVSEKAGRV
jgi:hypothetical protein